MKRVLNWGEFIKKHHNGYMSVAYGYTGVIEDAEDIVFGVYSTLIEKSYDNLNKIALCAVYNRCFNHMRDKARRGLNINYIDTEWYSSRNEYSHYETSDFLERIKLILTHRQYETIMLHADGYKMSEISAILGMSVGTAKNTVFRARQKIKRIK